MRMSGQGGSARHHPGVVDMPRLALKVTAGIQLQLTVEDVAKHLAGRSQIQHVGKHVALNRSSDVRIFGNDIASNHRAGMNFDAFAG